MNLIQLNLWSPIIWHSGNIKKHHSHKGKGFWETFRYYKITQEEMVTPFSATFFKPSDSSRNQNQGPPRAIRHYLLYCKSPVNCRKMQNSVSLFGSQLYPDWLWANASFPPAFSNYCYLLWTECKSALAVRHPHPQHAVGHPPQHDRPTGLNPHGTESALESFRLISLKNHVWSGHRFFDTSICCESHWMCNGYRFMLNYLVSKLLHMAFRTAFFVIMFFRLCPCETKV